MRFFTTCSRSTSYHVIRTKLKDPPSLKHLRGSSSSGHYPAHPLGYTHAQCSSSFLLFCPGNHTLSVSKESEMDPISMQCSARLDTMTAERAGGGGGRRESRSIRGGNNEQRERGREGEISIMGARRGENQWEAQIQWPPGGCFCFSLRQQLSSSWRTTPSFIYSRAHTSEGRREGRAEEEGERHSQWPASLRAIWSTFLWSPPPTFSILPLWRTWEICHGPTNTTNVRDWNSCAVARKQHLALMTALVIQIVLRSRFSTDWPS